MSISCNLFTICKSPTFVTSTQRKAYREMKIEGTYTILNNVFHALSPQILPLFEKEKLALLSFLRLLLTYLIVFGKLD